MSPGNTVALMFGGYDFMHLTMEIIHHPQRSTKPFLNPPWMIRICSHEQHEQPPTATMSRNWHLGLSPSARGNRHLWPWWPGSKLLSCTWCEQYRILVRQWKWWYNIAQKCPILKFTNLNSGLVYEANPCSRTKQPKMAFCSAPSLRRRVGDPK